MTVAARPDLMMLDGEYAVHRFDAAAAIPPEVLNTRFVTISRTVDELSVICPTRIGLKSERCEPGWIGFQIVGSLDFAMIGVLADLTAVLAAAHISLYAVSTYDTDYIFVKKEDADRSAAALTAAGYRFIPAIESS